MNGQLVEARQTDTHWLGRLVLQHPALVGTRVATDDAAFPTVMLVMHNHWNVLSCTAHGLKTTHQNIGHFVVGLRNDLLCVEWDVKLY